MSAARRFVTDALDELGRPDAAWAAQLIVSELATNVLLHARSAMEITVSATGGGVRLQVVDGSVAVPRMRSYNEQATTGRGLRLVQELSSTWGIEPVGTGKCIWVELAPPASAAGRSGRAAGVDELEGAADLGELDADEVLAMFPDDDAFEPKPGRMLASAGCA